MPAKTPLQQVELVMAQYPPARIPSLLAQLEQLNRQEGDLEALRALKEFRSKHFPTPAGKHLHSPDQS